MVHYIVPWFIILCYISLYCAMVHYIVPWLIILCHSALYCAMVHYIVPQFIILCHSALYCAMVHYIVPQQIFSFSYRFYSCSTVCLWRIIVFNGVKLGHSNEFFFHFSISGVCPSEFSFTLRIVREDGCWCERCPWYRFCRGCALDVNDDLFRSASSTIAIDWEPTFYHLRYQESLEFVRWSIPLLISGHYQIFPLAFRWCKSMKVFERHGRNTLSPSPWTAAWRCSLMRRSWAPMRCTTAESAKKCS